jgi:uncharacterized membrane protein HdeD (DUF308 family)
MAPAADDANAATARTLGILLMIVGLVLLFWPAATTRVLASLAGLGAVVYGVTELTRIYSGDGDHIEFSAGMIGLVSVFGGVIIAITPFVSESATSTVIGFYWLAGGTVEVVGSFLRPAARLERLLVGGISVAAGGLLLALPTASIVVLVWFAGGWMLVAGAAVVLMRSITPPRRAVV